MSSKKKTSVRAGAKSTNKTPSSTDRARKAVSQEIAERIASMEAAENNGVLHEAEVTRGDGEKVKVAVPADQPETGVAVALPATLATDAAGNAPATDAAKPAKAPRGATSGKTGGKGKGGAKEPKPAKPKKEKVAKPAKVKKVSCLDAAAQVLASSKEPLRPKQMIEMMEAKGLWKSGKGLTPEATLYAAIIREIAAKGRDARFKKHDRGVFVAGKAV